jgi:hypothetical protein
MVSIGGPVSRTLAGSLEVGGFVAGEVRSFLHHPEHEGQSGAALDLSLVLQPELRKELEDEQMRLTFIPFARIDSVDSQRTHLDVRELSVLRMGGWWDVRVGVDRIFWGVTESRHLVDIVNQTDLVESVDGEDKLGQPMVNVDLFQDWGTLSLFLLPYFRERTFPGEDGRLRAEPVVDSGRAVYESSLERWHPDLAVRWSRVFGDWDAGLSLFRGTGREPRLVAEPDGAGGVVLVPHYDLISQAGVDIQATKGKWLWKLEAIARSGQGKDFGAFVAGFEYTAFGLLGTAADLGLLGEYLYDGRDGTAPATALEDDIFLGARLTLNDPDDTSVLAGVIVDRGSGSTLISVEGEKRLSEFWKVEIEIEARIFAQAAENDPLYAFREDSYLQLHLARYF